MIFAVAASIPDKIDRFTIRRLLGKGSQGMVYLAYDPELKREVAIKAIRFADDQSNAAALEQLVAEARTISRLQHANIVSIFDITDTRQTPCLVLEHIDGQSLQQRIAEGIEYRQKLSIMRDVLEAVAAAHARGILHRDLKPANILINRDGRAKVADFGLALLNDGRESDGQSLYGTPQYMAPEYIDSQRYDKASDVFSLGLVFYEMLTGEPAFEGHDVYQLLHAIANSDVTAPSERSSEVDERLDALILQALARDPAQRYADAGEMLRAFNDYLALEESAAPRQDSDATTRFLLRRMRHKKDFPAFSHTLGVLNRASTSDTESLTRVANAILKDYSLTNKLLRLVNSAYYSRGGGKIGTISRAVVMLGLNPVRNLATGLMLFEHMQNRHQSDRLKSQAIESLFAGLLANRLAQDREQVDHEQAFLCALLQQLGKMLVRFYLHEEAEAIDKLILEKDCGESAAATRVLGTSYTRLGMAVAREWGFPAVITDSMLPLENVPEPVSAPGEQLRIITQFGSGLAAALAQPLETREQAVEALRQRFERALPLSAEQVDALLQTCLGELSEFAELIQFDLARSPYGRQQQSAATGKESQAAPDEQDISESMEILIEQSEPEAASIEKALSDGIQDITDTLTGEFELNQVLHMILETIYRAFGNLRVVLCLRDPGSGIIRARFGYGDDIETITESFVLQPGAASDVFRMALERNVDIRIDNTRDASIRARIPDWYHDKVGARSFTLFPIVVRQSAVALIYIDSGDRPGLRVSDAQLGLLKTLRNQAILAIRSLS